MANQVCSSTAPNALEFEWLSDPDEKNDSSPSGISRSAGTPEGAGSNVDQAAATSLFADLAKFFKMILEMSQKAKQAGREMRAAERDAMVAELMDAAKELMEAAKKRLNEAIVQGSMSITGGAIQFGGGCLAAGMSKEAADQAKQAAQAQKNGTNDTNSTITNASNADGTNNTAQAITMGSAALNQLIEATGKIVGACEEYQAAKHDSAKMEDEAQSKVAEDAMQQSIDLVHSATETLAAVLESFKEFGQNQNQTMMSFFRA